MSTIRKKRKRAIVDFTDKRVYNAVMISCVLLSAGESRRFGSPKALAVINNKSAIGVIQQTLLDSGLDEIFVVLGADRALIKPHVFNHKKVQLVYNKNYKFGQTSSFQAGITSINKKAKGIMLFPVDCPFITSATLRCLIEVFNEQNPSVLVPIFNHRRGHPSIFNASLKKEIMLLPAERGINTLFDRHAPTLLEVHDSGILKTFNTPEELKQSGN